MDEPLTDVIETQSEDEASPENPPRGAQRPRASRLGRITAGLRSQKYILKENNDPRKADESLKRVHAVVWMKDSTRKNQTPGLLECKLMTPGLLVPVGFEWTLPLKGKMTYLTVERKFFCYLITLELISVANEVCFSTTVRVCRDGQ
jgi:hypothetical protein